MFFVKPPSWKAGHDKHWNSSFMKERGGEHFEDSDRFTRSSAHTLTHIHTHAKVMIMQNTHKHTHRVSDAATVTTCNMNLSTHRWICKVREKAVWVKTSCDNLSLHFRYAPVHLVLWMEKQLRYCILEMEIKRWVKRQSDQWILGCCLTSQALD